MNVNAKRIYWSNVKGLLIFLVVMGHFIQVFLEKQVANDFRMLQGILCIIYSFHMPLFIFVSGFFSKNLEKRRSKALEDLMIPYFIIQLIWMIYYGIFDHSFSVIKNIFYPQFSLWYLMALFIWRIMLTDLIKIKYILPISAVLFFAGMFCTGIDNNFAMQRTIGFLFFFLLGYYIDDQKVKKLQQVPLVIPILCLFVAFLTIFVLVWSNVISFNTLFYTFTHTKYIITYTNIVTGTLLYAFSFLLACIISVSILMVCNSKLCWLSSVGENTFPLYLSHGIVVHLCNRILIYIQLQNELLILFILAILAFFTTWIGSCGAYRKVFSNILSCIKKWVLVRV